MKIALLGYGKMGKEIESIAQQRLHTVPLKINSSNKNEITIANLQKADVAIEFSQPENAIGNILKCFEAGIPVVVGTTGWYEHFQMIESECKKNNATLLYATNFSIGVNLFFALNRYLAHLMKNYTEYRTSIEETHHSQKLDSPSGTAITLAEGIMKVNSHLKKWVNETTDNTTEIPITSHRIGNVPGTHHITYHSAVDSIEIKHTAHNRSGFALGAVLAAEWLQHKKGIFTINDIINF
ncbi:MAG: 4-hydroxy-tetrahydrodipicolinate reductase [Flavobacteriales bacterium]|nr:4-hydroxy-tetrahydrodipicolinate reductase [Flavobacteriales bacterium]